MSLKWYGTAAILLEQDGTSLLFDPFLPLGCDAFMPPMDELSAAEHILVTHGHLDHIVSIPAVFEHGGGKAAVYCTAKPREVLASKRIGAERIREIRPGDVLNIGPFEVRVLKGRHIVFDKGLILKTLFSPRVLHYRGNLRFLLKENRICAETDETVVYDISASNKRILILGSLNLDDQTDYPRDADLVILPFQGRSGISEYAIPFIDRLRPKKMLLDHFDDTFPPISSVVKTGRFISLMRQKYPGVPVICPQADPGWIEVE